MKIQSDFHSRLIGFCGFSGSGKTTLVEKLIRLHSSRYSIGYIKHDAHHFELDHAGKDTYRQTHAGASRVFINDPKHFALMGQGDSFGMARDVFQDCSFVFVEGHKYLKHPKFLFLDDLSIEEYNNGNIENVIATLSSSDKREPSLKIDLSIPHFHRDNVEEIWDLILLRFKAPPLKAIILAGGQSRRMGQNKALMKMNSNGSQIEHFYNLFKSTDVPVYLSCRSDQEKEYASYLPDIPLISDVFIGKGPLGGILSAMSFDRSSAWLVVACDLPFIDKNAISSLISERCYFHQATSYYNLNRKHYEPLFSIYEPSIYSRMLQFLAYGYLCPQKVLYNSRTKTINLADDSFLANMNTLEDLEKIGVENEY